MACLNINGLPNFGDSKDATCFFWRSFVETAEANPNGVFALEASATEPTRISYRAAHQHALVLGDCLERLGKPDGKIAVLCPKSPDELIVFLGLRKIKRCGVFLSTEWRASQIEEALRKYPFAFLMIHEAILSEFKSAISALDSYGSRELPLEFGSFRIFTNPFYSSEQTSSEKRAWGLMTSGSTGLAKLVEVSSIELYQRALEEIEDFGLLEITVVDRAIGTFLKPSTDLGLNQILVGIMGKFSLIYAESVFASETIAKFAAARVAGITGIPSFWRRFLFEQQKSKSFLNDKISLRYITVSGGSLTKNEILKLRTFFPKTNIIRTYGQTETFRSLIEVIKPDDSVFERTGYPLRSVVLTLVDAKPVEGEPSVVRGELQHLSTNSVASRTGDIFDFHTSEGWYRFVGRLDDLVKIQDLRVHPQILENAIMSLNRFQDCVAVVVGQRFVVFTEGGLSTETVGSTKEFEKEIRKLVPRVLYPERIVRLDKLPRLASGKADRNELALRARAIVEDAKE